MATNYPASIDSLPRPSASTKMDATGFEGDVVIDNLSDAVEAIQTELGTDPAGAQTTVKARLDGMAASFVGAAWASGTYASTALATDSTFSTMSLYANRVHYFPWWSTRGVTLDRIAVEVTTPVASANARIGLYGSASSAAGGPGSLIADFGEIDCSSTGVKELTISQSVDGSHMYWLSILHESNGVIYRSTPTSNTLSFYASATNSGHLQSYCYETITYASGFPSSATSLGSLTFQTGVVPMFGTRFREAALQSDATYTSGIPSTFGSISSHSTSAPIFLLRRT